MPATRRRWSPKKTASRTKAPWRETRLIDFTFGVQCRPGYNAECLNPPVDAAFQIMPPIGAPCATILLVPILIESDFQFPGSQWKERVTQTSWEVEAMHVPNYLWIASALYRSNQSLLVGAFPTGIFIQTWRSAAVMFDVDEVSATAITSLWADGYAESEKVIPGTWKQGTLMHTGIGGSESITPMTTKISTRSRMKRRLETGQGLYWQYELGCATFNGRNAANTADLDFNEAFAAFAGPMWIQGRGRVSYME